MEIVINNCFGGFGLSNLALKKYVESKGMEAYFYEKVSFNEKYIKVPYDKNGIITYCVSEDLGDTINHKEFMAWIEKNKDKYFSESHIDRTDKDLIKIIKELGSKKASTFEGKADPIAYDFVDNIAYLVKSYKKRCSIYKKNGCYFVEEVQND